MDWIGPQSDLGDSCYSSQDVRFSNNRNYIMEKIFTEIRDNVEKEAGQLLSRAKRVAEREVKYARIEAEKILSDHNFEIQKQAGLLEEREKAQNSVDDRKTEMEQCQHFVEQLFKIALEEIKNIPRNEKYESWIKHLLINGIKNFNKENVIIFSSEKDSEIVMKTATEFNVKCSGDYLDVEGGIVLKSADNRMTVDLSARAILESKKDDLRSEVVSKINFKATD